MAKPTILVLDDEPEILEITALAFEGQGYEVFTAAGGEEALTCVKEKHPQVLLIDYRLKGDMTGLDFLKAARLVDPGVPAVMITGLSEQVETLKAECERVGISAFFQKPLQMDAVYDAVKKALDSAPQG